MIRCMGARTQSSVRGASCTDSEFSIPAGKSISINRDLRSSAGGWALLLPLYRGTGIFAGSKSLWSRLTVQTYRRWDAME